MLISSKIHKIPKQNINFKIKWDKSKISTSSDIQSINESLCTVKIWIVEKIKQNVSQGIFICLLMILFSEYLFTTQSTEWEKDKSCEQNCIIMLDIGLREGSDNLIDLSRLFHKR